jgi:hypothetical protein
MSVLRPQDNSSKTLQATHFIFHFIAQIFLFVAFLQYLLDNPCYYDDAHDENNSSLEQRYEVHSAPIPWTTTWGIGAIRNVVARGRWG